MSLDRRSFFIAPLLACVVLAAPLGTAQAAISPTLSDEVAPRDPPTGWAVFAGGATALVPLAIGGAFFADGSDTHRRWGGSLAIVSGLALAPVVSHLIVREWSRAAIFGAIPIACAIGTAVLLQVQPTTTIYGTHDSRLSFGLLLSFATLSSAVGVLDTLGATRRAAERRPRRGSVLPMPFVTSGGGGVTIGGVFQ